VLTAGVDIVDVERIRRAVERYGAPFERRICTEAERAYCYRQPARLAGLFAAKEAVSKALGTGLAHVATGGVDLRDIEILFDSRGQPSVSLHGTAKVHAEELGLALWSITLSRSQKYALAFAVAS
jgi:holo-[acyl-carrier protein] synthase